MQKKRIMGCSFPVFIFAAVVIVGIILFGVIVGPIGQNLLPNLKFPSWLVVPQPEPSLPPEVVFHIGGFAVTNTIIAAWFSIVILVLFTWLAFRKSRLIPSRLQSLFELILAWLLNLCESVAGEKNGRRFFPVIATIFLFVLTNAWLSLLPFFNAVRVYTTQYPPPPVPLVADASGKIPFYGVPLFRSAGTDANLTLALAIVSFIFVTYFGIKLARKSFLGAFFNFGPFINALKDLFRGKVKSALGGMTFGFISIFVGLIELLTYFIRIISFTFRLFGNMTAGELLLGIIMFLVPWLVAPFFYGLELIIGVIQAFIFAGLTLVFAGLAVTSHSEEHA